MYLSLVEGSRSEFEVLAPAGSIQVSASCSIIFDLFNGKIGESISQCATGNVLGHT